MRQSPRRPRTLCSSTRSISLPRTHRQAGKSLAHRASIRFQLAVGQLGSPAKAAVAKVVDIWEVVALTLALALAKATPPLCHGNQANIAPNQASGTYGAWTCRNHCRRRHCRYTCSCCTHIGRCCVTSAVLRAPRRLRDSLTARVARVARSAASEEYLTPALRDAPCWGGRAAFPSARPLVAGVAR